MKKVLVVDDTKNIRMVLTKCLELEGYEVTSVCDGKQALEMFETCTFDLAFLDIKLPEVRGTEVLKRIRASGVNTPVIIITAYATVKNAIDCTNLGAVAYIQKPFTADKIKSTLSELDINHVIESKKVYCVDRIVSEARKFLGEGEYSKALSSLKKALAYELDNSEVYLLIGKAYEGLGDIKNAERFTNFHNTFLI